MKTTAERIQSALDIRGMKQADLAAQTRIGKSSIHAYITGEYLPKQNNIYKMALALNVSEAWLMGYDVPMERNSVSQTTIPAGFEPLPKMVKVPLVGSIACGEPITAEENLEGYVDAPEDVRCDFALTCKGDSMIDAGISDGDVVYIRSQPEVENGEIAAVRLDGEATLKRVYLDGEQLTLMPANAKYPPKTYSGDALEEIHIEGKAVAFTHWFEKG